MQFHLNGFEPGDPEISDPAERHPGAGAQGSVPAEVDVLIVGCGPAGLTLAAQLSAFPGIKTCIVEQKPGPLQLGQADGVACRTITVARHLHPDSLRPSSLFDVAGVAPDASVHPTAEIEDGVIIDPGAVIGPHAGIGSGTVIGANAVIGPNVQIGRDCSIGPNASIVHALIGDGVIIHAGSHIGHDGFRYQPGARGLVKMPQLGRVIVQDNVEISVNTTIDRGGDTVIGEGTKIDNLVQIGHNCMIGRHCILVSQCGISGSVTIGDYAVLGGKVGVADHVTIGEGAMIAAKSGVMSDIPAGEKWMGYPAMRGREYLRRFAASKRK
jgi:UDP-3-O-[3-hydroxymyristoyl] glucosamine N-acyltransferase